MSQEVSYSGVRSAAAVPEETTVTTLKDRPNSALLVIDVQNGVVANAHERDGVIANINTLVDKARREDVPVIWVQHSGEDMPIDSEEWKYVPELVRTETEPLVPKLYGDSFEDTNLEDLLAERNVGRLVITGAQTDACVRSTMHGGLTRGYDVTLVGDAHTTDDYSQYGLPTVDKVIAHTNMYWNYQEAPGRKGGTVSTVDVTYSTVAED